MPDESCRTCGGELISHSICSECRKPTQHICKICDTTTNQQYHQNCLHIESIKTMNGMQMDIITTKNSDFKTKKADNTKNNFSFKNLLLVFNIVGFLVLGLTTADYLDLYQTQTNNIQISKSNPFFQKLQLAITQLLIYMRIVWGMEKGNR